MSNSSVRKKQPTKRIYQQNQYSQFKIIQQHNIIKKHKHVFENIEF